MHTPSSAFMPGSISIMCQLYRLLGAEHGAGGDAEQEGVADLTSSPGDGDGDRFVHSGTCWFRFEGGGKF